MTFTTRGFGGPTVTFPYGGLTVLTDPTFDPAGTYPVGDRALTKTADAAGPAAAAGPVDLVLLSHDQHPDNLDRAGRAFLATVPLILTTPAGAGRLGPPARGLTAWETVDLPGGVRVTGVPAQHGPDGTEHLTGEVTGFLLSGEGLSTVYVSCDNASLDVVGRVAGHAGRVDLAVLFAGAAQTPLIPEAYLTLTSAQAAEAARLLDAPQVVVVHTDSWAHFTETLDDVRTAFTDAGLADRLLSPAHGSALGL